MLKEQVPGLSPDQRIVVAYDGMSLDRAADMHAGFKEAGLYPMAKANSLATRVGLDAVMARFHPMDSGVMFDPKYKDTTGTMGNYMTEVVSAEPARPDLVTIHADNGMAALRDAVDTRAALLGPEPNGAEILGITVLTTLDDEDVRSIYGEGATALNEFVKFAHRAQEAGLQGLVSSGEELIEGYRYQQLNGLLRVIPGITLPGQQTGKGQKRVYEPDQAIGEGADLVVIGSAITKADNPTAALETATELVAKAA